MPHPDFIWPDWPRGMSEGLAAAYVGISVSSLRTEVLAGRAPAAVWITKGRKIWLREDLDAWLNRAAGRPGSTYPIVPEPENPLDAFFREREEQRARGVQPPIGRSPKRRTSR
jgi:hypothetical protein